MDQPGVLGIVIAHVRPRVISLVDMYCFSFNLTPHILVIEKDVDTCPG